ncbi:MAG: hypothetical protein HYR56_24600 [Acidobacteria bacterium]|nr:hypothetical protein [Acidobacteriota bacterium]MBI3422082.1 hypothetical protein [Acidobacteriota bacterium]
MQLNYRRILFTFVNAALLYAATLMVTPLPPSVTAFERVQGQDKAGKNCERIDSPGSSTFGKCENVCKDKEVTRDAPNNRWVCKAAKTVGAQTGANHVPLNGQVLDAGSKAPAKAPRTEGVKAGKTKKN